MSTLKSKSHDFWSFCQFIVIFISLYLGPGQSQSVWKFPIQELLWIFRGKQNASSLFSFYQSFVHCCACQHFHKVMPHTAFCIKITVLITVWATEKGRKCWFSLRFAFDIYIESHTSTHAVHRAAPWWEGSGWVSCISQVSEFFIYIVDVWLII